MLFVPTSASSISFLEPAGLDNAVGLISSSNQKDTLDRNGPTMRAWNNISPS